MSRYLKRYFIYVGFAFLLVGFFAVFSPLLSGLRYGFSTDPFNNFFQYEASASIIHPLGLLGFILFVLNWIFALRLDMPWWNFFGGKEELLENSKSLFILGCIVWLLNPHIPDKDPIEGILNNLTAAYFFLNKVFNVTSDAMLVGCCLMGYWSTFVLVVIIHSRTNRDSLRYTDGLAEFSWQGGGKVGLLDKNGIQVLPPVYDSIGVILHGRAAVQDGHKWGYIKLNAKNRPDQIGKFWIDPKYDFAGPFVDASTFFPKAGVKARVYPHESHDNVPRFVNAGTFGPGALVARVRSGELKGWIAINRNHYWIHNQEDEDRWEEQACKERSLIKGY